MCDLAEGI